MDESWGSGHIIYLATKLIEILRAPQNSAILLVIFVRDSVCIGKYRSTILQRIRANKQFVFAGFNSGF